MPRPNTSRNGPVTSYVSQEAEDAVRRYLNLLDNPGSPPPPEETVDVDLIRAEAEDPLDAIKLVSKALDAAAEVEDPETAFIRYARTWSEHNGVSREAFEAFGVKPTVLAKAFGPRTKPPRTTTRAKAVDRGTLATGIKNTPPGTILTTGSIATDFGGSPDTIRRVLRDLIAEGTLINLGPDPNHRDKGRAPVLYERT